MMKLVVLAFTALASIVTAQDQWYNIQSPPFRLIVKSADNSTLNDTALGACHQGAAIEGLCVTGEKVTDPVSSYTTFYHNVSSNTLNGSSIDNFGILGYNLQAGSMNVPSAMRFSILPTSNVANANFFPGWNDPSTVQFEAAGSMYITAYTNDQVSPVTYFDPPLHVKNWFICATKFSYSYDTLVWKIGLAGQPQNPACQYVDVVRVFV